MKFIGTRFAMLENWKITRKRKTAGAVVIFFVFSHKYHKKEMGNISLLTQLLITSAKIDYLI